MITKKDAEVKTIKHNPSLLGGFEPNFKIDRHSITANTGNKETRYILHLSFILAKDEQSLDNPYLHLKCSGYYDFDINISDITERNLYEAIILATNQMSKYVVAKRLLKNVTSIIPPPYSEMIVALSPLLQKR
jgi:hypothetical protein